MLRIIRQDFQPLLAACLLYIILGPYFVWELDKTFLFQPVIAGVFALLFIKNNAIKYDRILFAYLFFLLVYYFVSAGLSLAGFIFTGLSIFAPFGKAEFSKKVFHYFVNIYTILIAISSVVWIGVLCGLVMPIGTLEPGGEKTTIFNLYPFVVSANTTDIFRFCGLFDEPGAVGTMNCILLYILGFSFKDWKTYFLLFSGFLSLSLFFYVAIVLYFIIKSFSQLNLKLIIILSVLLGLFYFSTKDNELIADRIWNRIEWDSSKGSIAGDNRMHDEANKIYKSKKYSFAYWFGDSDIKRYEATFEGSSSYKVIVLRSGMIFFISYLMFFIVLARKYTKRTHLLLFIALLLAVEFQRPWMFGAGYLFLFPYYVKFCK